MLDQDYRPIGEPDAEPRPPAYPERVKAFELACGLYALELDIKMAAAGRGGG